MHKQTVMKIFVISLSSNFLKRLYARAISGTGISFAV